MNEKEVESRLRELGQKIEERDSCVDAVLSRLETENNTVKTGETIMKSPFPLVRMLFALSACLLLLLGMSFIWNSPSGRLMAFSQAQRMLQEFETLILRLETEDEPELNATIHALGDGSYRLAYAGGITQVHDAGSGETLGLNPDSKEFSLNGVSEFDFMDEYRLVLEAKESAIEELGQREIEGRMLIGYTIKPAHQEDVDVYLVDGIELEVDTTPHAELWCDPTTGRPVVMYETENEHCMTIHFEFGPPLEASLFSIQPPAGYVEVDIEDSDDENIVDEDEENEGEEDVEDVDWYNR